MYKFEVRRFFRLKPCKVHSSNDYNNLLYRYLNGLSTVEWAKHVIENLFIRWHIAPVPVKQIHARSDVMDRYAVPIMDASAFPVEGPAMTERSPLTPVPKTAVDHLMDDYLVKSQRVIVEALGGGQRPCPPFAEEPALPLGYTP